MFPLVPLVWIRATRQDGLKLPHCMHVLLPDGCLGQHVWRLAGEGQRPYVPTGSAGVD